MLCSSTISISKASPAMPFYARRLTAVLSERLPSSWHRARLKFMARYVGSLLKLTTTNGKKIALAPGPAGPVQLQLPPHPAFYVRLRV